MTINPDTEKKILKLNRDIKRVEDKINSIENNLSAIKEQFKKFTKIATFNSNRLKNEIANKQGSV